MQNMNLNNNSQAQHANTHVQIEEEPPASPTHAAAQLQASSSCKPQLPQHAAAAGDGLAQLAAADDACQSTISPGDVSWQQLLLQAEAPALQHQQQQQQGQGSGQLALCTGPAGGQRRSYSLCSTNSSGSGSEAGNNNGSLEQLEEAMKQALAPSSAAANLLPAHGSLRSQVGWLLVLLLL
jgi:hypothetical protein